MHFVPLNLLFCTTCWAFLHSFEAHVLWVPTKVDRFQTTELLVFSCIFILFPLIFTAPYFCRKNSFVTNSGPGFCICYLSEKCNEAITKLSARGVISEPHLKLFRVHKVQIWVSFQRLIWRFFMLCDFLLMQIISWLTLIPKSANTHFWAAFQLTWDQFKQPWYLLKPSSQNQWRSIESLCWSINNCCGGSKDTLGFGLLAGMGSVATPC